MNKNIYPKFPVKGTLLAMGDRKGEKRGSPPSFRAIGSADAQDINIYIELEVPEKLVKRRLDQALAELCPKFSRSQIQHWIRQGFVKTNEKVTTKPKMEVHLGERIIISAPLTPHETWQAQEIPLKVVYQDSDLLIIDKPAGLVVHPGAGNPENTLVNALLHFDPSLANVPRAGLVHRLDKQTSGLLVVAKNLAAHNYLVKILQLREIKREYLAIVQGLVRSSGEIKTMIGRHPIHRTKMSVVTRGKSAITHYQVLKTFRAHSLVKVNLETGRTHQIRVHLAHINHPLVGDPEYGRRQATHLLIPSLRDFLVKFQRQALHAVQLTLTHPTTGEVLSWVSPIPDDMQQLLNLLEEDKNENI